MSEEKRARRNFKELSAREQENLIINRLHRALEALPAHRKFPVLQFVLQQLESERYANLTARNPESVAAPESKQLAAFD